MAAPLRTVATLAVCVLAVAIGLALGLPLEDPAMTTTTTTTTTTSTTIASGASAGEDGAPGAPMSSADVEPTAGPGASAAAAGSSDAALTAAITVGGDPNKPMDHADTTACEGSVRSNLQQYCRRCMLQPEYEALSESIKDGPPNVASEQALHAEAAKMMQLVSLLQCTASSDFPGCVPRKYGRLIEQAITQSPADCDGEAGAAVHAAAFLETELSVQDVGVSGHLDKLTDAEEEEAEQAFLETGGFSCW